RGLPYCLTTRDEIDICDERSIRAAIARYQPWAIINAAGFVRVADAEHDKDACLTTNAAGPALLARACAEAGIPFVTFSSDLVVDGTLGRAYCEQDEVRPAGVYGLSKAQAEENVLGLGGQALVIRTSAFFGPWDKYNFAWNTLSALARGEPVRACRNSAVSPTYVPDLCHATLDLLIDGADGIWHLSSGAAMSWADFARAVARACGLDASLVDGVPHRDFGWAAARPAQAARARLAAAQATTASTSGRRSTRSTSTGPARRTRRPVPRPRLAAQAAWPAAR
ncbi:MAG: family oxidoreductase, partial [Thermoleophilia bacterium]|nr:family oxidoreductase [Thermoleophilia bacterium]